MNKKQWLLIVMIVVLLAASMATTVYQQAELVQVRATNDELHELLTQSIAIGISEHMDNVRLNKVVLQCDLAAR